MKTIINKHFLKLTSILTIMLFTRITIYAEETTSSPGQMDAETLKKANSPLAKTKALNVNNYVISDIYGLPDMSANQLIVRYAQPVGSFLLRASMPLIVSSAPNQSPISSFGDFNMFAIYKFPSLNGNELGIGPSLTAPTGTHDQGQGKWQAGISALAFFAKSPVIQMGSLLQWQSSFAGDKDKPDVSMLTSQIFFIWQIGGGAYLRSTGAWAFNLKNGDYNVPIGLGIGKVIKSKKIVFNVFAEPQYSVLAQGIGQPKFQTFIGFNTQF